MSLLGSWLGRLVGRWLGDTAGSQWGDFGPPTTASVENAVVVAGWSNATVTMDAPVIIDLGMGLAVAGADGPMACNSTQVAWASPESEIPVIVSQVTG